MMEQQSFHPLDYMSVVHRRKWWFLVPVAVCVAAGLLAVAVWPRTYLSKAAIGVQAPTLSPELLKGVSSMDPSERQRAIQQLLFSPSVLDRVIRDEKLGKSKPTSEVAAGLRENLSQNIEVPLPIGLNGRPDPSRGIDLFYLGYTDRDPQRAQCVADRVASVFVEENSKVQTVRAENTADVLQQAVADSQAKLTDLENKLTAKKKNYVGQLPDQVGANVQMVNGARSQLESLSIQLRSEQDHLSMAESQLDAMRQGVGVEGVTTSTMAATQAAQKHIDDLEGQLASDRALGFLDKHPDVQRLQQEIKQAKAALVASKADQPSNREETLKTDPIYRAKIQERDMARLHIKDLQAGSANAQAQIGNYQRRVEAAPVVEQELTSLQREYDLEKAHYGDLTTRYQNATTAEDVSRKQGGERFTVLYPANLPESPIAPQPLKIMALAIVAGLILGAGAAVGREFLDRSVHDLRGLQSEFEVPVLGEIPRIA